MDQATLLTLNTMASWPVVGPVCGFINHPASGLVLLLVVLAWAREKRRLPLAGWAILAVVISDPFVARVLKPLFARDRPYLHVPDLFCPFGAGGGFSMPSNHAANCFAIAAAVGAPWLYVVAAGVALSRVVIGVHYPSDVLVGAAVGTAIGLGVRTLGTRLVDSRRIQPGEPRGRGTHP